MNTPSDDDLRQRLQELGRREAGTAPPLARVLQGSRPDSDGVPTGSVAAGWVRGAVALAGACAVVAALAWRGPTTPKVEAPVVSQAERFGDPVMGWDLPSDGLLIEVGDETDEREVDGLSREIEGLLQP